MPLIKLETVINAPIDKVFDLARSIDLHKSSMQHTNEVAIAGKTEGFIELGETVTWRAKHLGFYQTLTVKITEFEKPFLFVDEMLSGAFKSMRHKHIFKQVGEKTIMIDEFEYVAPLGVLGKLADTLFLKKYMKNLLLKRNEALKRIAEGSLC